MKTSFRQFLLIVFALGCVVTTSTSRSSAQGCIGDCNGNGGVSLGEVQTSLDIFFDDRPLSGCVSADANSSGGVSLGEVQSSLDNFFDDCPGAPTRTATPTVQRVDTPTVPPHTPTHTSAPTHTSTATRTATPVQVPPTPDSLLFAGTILELIPHGLGDSLTYAITRTGGGDSAETRTVTAVGSDGGGLTFSVRVVEARDETTEDFVDRGNELILRHLEEKDQQNVCTTCSPELLQLRTPLVAGQTSVSNSICSIRLCRSGTFLGSFPQQNEITPMERLDSLEVPAGTYHGVIRIKAVAKILNGEEVNDLFIVPGLGLIRRDFEFGSTRITRVLVDGVVGGESVRQ